MMRSIRILLCMILLPTAGFSQTADALNEGSTFVSVGNNSYRFTWWARPGAYYLVDVSADLFTWNYIDTVFVGFGGISQPIYFYNVQGDRVFVRLQTDPFNTDSDGDGIPDGWEVLNGLNARFAGDAALNPDGDDYTNLEEYALGLDPHFNEYANGQRTQIYTYDNANKVTVVSSNLSEGFGYDDEGNLTSLQ